MSGTTLPTTITKDGLQPQAPADLNAQLIALATVYSPGLTANLPGSLIEDISSTDTGALVVIDQARVELVNSLTPYGANAFLLNQIGQLLGVQIGQQSNTSVFVVFTGTAGYVLPKGFVVSDGTYQYALTDGGIVGTGGVSVPLFAVATQQGSFAVPAGTVTQTVTSFPSSVRLTVSNPLDGTPGTDGQTEEDYRAVVLQGCIANAQGMASLLKTLLINVPGVQARLVSVRQQVNGGWEVIVGGSGDPYAIGNAIYRALFDISTLTGSTFHVTNITNANPAVVTIDLNHGYANGQAVVIAGATGMVGANGSWTATVLSQNTFSIPFNATSAGTYTGNGTVTPNFRNQTISIFDSPDVYSVPYVVPPSQSVSMVVTWNTTSTGFISPVAVAQAGQPALAAYINSIPVGQPINLFELQTTFQTAIAGLINPVLVTRMVFAISINGIGVAPTAGTGIIQGDPESYFTTTSNAVTVNQG